MIFNRVQNILIAAPSCDQAGSRLGYSCEDRIFASSILIEKSNEFGKPCRVAVLDFKKAFDTLSHASIWEALQEQGISNTYIHVLQQLYKDQYATLQTD